jgi:hypothetical protein
MKFAYHILIFRLLTYVKIANSIVANVMDCIVIRRTSQAKHVRFLG